MTNTRIIKKMGLRKFYKIWPLVILMLVCAVSPGFAQVADSTAASNTMASDSAVTQAATDANAGATSISTDVDTTQLSWSGGGIEVEKPIAGLSEAYRSAGYYFLIFFLFCVFLGIIGKVLRLYELSNEIQGKVKKINWNRVQGIIFGLALVIGIYGAYWSYAVQGPMAITESATEHGHKLDLMFNITLVITTIVFILTHILLFGFSYVYAGSEKRKAYYYPHNNTVERVWTIVPAFVLAGLVLFGFFTWRNITEVPEAEQKSAISVEVIGQQFSWNVRYPGRDNKLGYRNYKLTTPNNTLGIDFTKVEGKDDLMSNDIVLPVGKSVRVTIGSKDILHSFYIPDFRAQINAVPGMTTHFQFKTMYTTAEMREKRKEPEFDYILLCAKICGAGHYNMQKKVIVVTQQEYEEWLAKQPLYYNDDVKKEMLAASEKSVATTNTIALNK